MRIRFAERRLFFMSFRSFLSFKRHKGPKAQKWVCMYKMCCCSAREGGRNDNRNKFEFD